MVFPLDDKFVFGDDFFFLADNFFFAEGVKKNYSAQKKILLTNKRSYSSNGNTFMPMILTFSVNQQLFTSGHTPGPNQLHRNFSDYYKNKGWYVNFHEKQHGIYPPQHRKSEKSLSTLINLKLNFETEYSL